MEQLIILLIFGGIALVNWLLKQGGSKFKQLSRETQEQQQRQETAIPSQRRPDADSEDERMRKFFEALGLPPGSTPPVRTQRPAQPPAIPNRPASPRQPVFEADPELVRREQHARRARRQLPPSRPLQHETPAILQPQTMGAARSPAQPIFQAAEVVAESARATEQFPSGSLSTPASTQRNDLFAMLKSPANIRNAIVLREILGAPRGLQSGEPHAFPLS